MFRSIFQILCALLTTYLGAHLSEPKPAIISLGAGCAAAWVLKECGLRHAAFPFDWLASSNHQGFIKCLEENFEAFLDPEQLQEVLDYPNFLKNSYAMVFHHEGSTPFAWDDREKLIEQIQPIKEKYQRRIKRFQELDQYLGHIFFIRNFCWDVDDPKGQYTQQIEQVQEVLKRYFPHLSFTLVVITFIDAQAPELEMPEGVIEFRMHRAEWKEEHAKIYYYLLSTC